jgi:4-amino-4-deoxy-L-arabinose transferase-like glycosyltransferase
MARRGLGLGLGLTLIVAVSVARVAATHHVFSATADETQHIAAGIEWLRGSFSLWREQGLPHVIANPPLARIAVGLGPARAGVRDTRLRDVLYDGPGYLANLTSARRGTLPFLALLLGLVWVAARRLFGEAAGLAAAAALGTVPVVLGHAGLATTDVAAAATYLLAFLALVRWLEAPSRARAGALGVAFGLALMTKLSALTLLPGALVIVAVRSRSTRAALVGSRAALAQQLALAAGATALVAWAFYRFSFGRPDALADPATLRSLVEGCVASPSARRGLTAALGLPVPAPALVDGLVVLCAHNGPGRATSYLLGQISQSGFPSFFPVALAVKTPLPFLMLAAFGIAYAARGDSDAASRDDKWRRLAPALAALTVLACAIPSRINVGVRHVLQIYPLLAIYAGHGVVALWRAARPLAGRAAAVGLATWQLAIPLRASPDYLAWFNGLAGRHPESVLLDSDLDWGQDLLRLETALAERHVQRVSIAYFGPSDLCRHHLPVGRWLRPHERATGVIAISQMYRKGVLGFFYRDGNYCDRTQWVRSAPPDPAAYAWLDAYEPVARVGKSILLYDIPSEGTGRGP